ncbi:MAG: 4Fe-4S dicluster domain-containing protein [Deltaproteobacteria bacterium]|nr:4Fe-4S dicluster domain-containing protein [Deltaproteobacteria bacterium]
MKLAIGKEKFHVFLGGLKADYRLYGPVKKEGAVCFAPLENVEEVDLVSPNSLLSPKELFLPQSEKMFECSLNPESEDGHILKEVPRDLDTRVVVGIRPCDARALALVDVNFDTPTYGDPWWKQARENTILVGLGCDHPCATCFCASVGGGPFDETGLDVLLVDAGAAFVAKSITEKGKKLLGSIKGYPEASAELQQQAKEIARDAADKVVTRVDTSGLAAMDTESVYEAPFWDDVQFSCIHCGTCTFLCPTCWCFDIQDECCGSKAIRMRNWDSCMFPMFTLHASGHNPRGTRLQRVRQRFMHKLKYYVDKYGDGVACVGCGRCIQHCPVNIDIREVIALMNESAKEKE